MKGGKTRLSTRIICIKKKIIDKRFVKKAMVYEEC